LPESRVVKVNADLLAFEPLPIDIGITMSFKLGLREEVGDWKKNACPDPWTYQLVRVLRTASHDNTREASLGIDDDDATDIFCSQNQFALYQSRFIQKSSQTAQI
jgi:hypothetical protein